MFSDYGGIVTVLFLAKNKRTNNKVGAFNKRKSQSS